MNRWLQAGIGVGLGYVIWKLMHGEPIIANNGSVLAGPIEMNGYKRTGKKPWRQRTAMRVGEREKMKKRSPSCFLVPSESKYPVCPKGSSKPSCEGLLAARRRAIMNKDNAVRAKAERRALALGCGWAQRSKALVV
jgi:hypothetical protein